MFKWLDELSITWLRHGVSVLWLLDIIITSMLVMRDGVEIEANPLMLIVLENFGIVGFVVIKIFALLFFLYATSFLYHERPYKRMWKGVLLLTNMTIAYAVGVGAILLVLF